MSNGYAPKDIKALGLEPLAGVLSASPISQDAGLSSGGSLHLRVDVKASAVTVVGSIAVKLQMRAPNGAFTDLAGANATASISADGIVSMTQLVERAADQANMPLQKQLRVVVTTTNAGDALTIDNVFLYQEL